MISVTNRLFGSICAAYFTIYILLRTLPVALLPVWWSRSDHMDDDHLSSALCEELKGSTAECPIYYSNTSHLRDLGLEIIDQLGFMTHGIEHNSPAVCLLSAMPHTVHSSSC